MENSDFETILTVKEFDRCCSFYHGLFRDSAICVNSSFLLKLRLSASKTLELRAADPLDENFAEQTAALNFDLETVAIEHAIEYLLQYNVNFSAENNHVSTFDPAGNILTLRASSAFDFKTVRDDSITQKVKIS